MSGRRCFASLGAITASCLILVGLMTSPRAAAANGDVTQFQVFGIPADITSGADGNLWFTDYIGNQIVKITPAGVLTRYPIPTFFSLPSSITTGSDGNVWFAEVNGNKIGRITPAGVITEFVVPTPGAGLYGGITAGSDGNVWFAEGNNGKLGRITPAGVITEFSGIGAYELASGPDGNLWTVNPFRPQSAGLPPRGRLRSSSHRCPVVLEARSRAAPTETSGSPTLPVAKDM